MSVKVPVENLVHQEGKGWTVAKYLLGYERMGTGRVGASKRELARLKELAADYMKDGRPLLDDPRFRDRLTRVEVELMALEITNLRFLDQMRRTGRPPGADVSMLKIKGTEIHKSITELTTQAAGPLAQAFRPVDAIDSITSRRVSPRATATCARPPSTQAPTRSSATSSPRPPSVCDVMNFDLSEEQQLLADSLKRYLANEYSINARAKIVASSTGWSEAVWAAFAEMGLPGCRLPRSTAASAVPRWT